MLEPEPERALDEQLPGRDLPATIGLLHAEYPQREADRQPVEGDQDARAGRQHVDEPGNRSSDGNEERPGVQAVATGNPVDLVTFDGGQLRLDSLVAVARSMLLDLLDLSSPVGLRRWW